MIVSLGKRRAMLSSVVTRMRSTLTSVGVSGFGRITIPVWNKHDHPVPLRALVDRRVALVIVVLQRAGQFAQPAKPCVVELVYEGDRQRVVEPDRAQPDESIRVLLHGGEHIRDVRGLRQDQRGSIEWIEPQRHLLQEGFVAVVVDVAVHQSTQGCLPPKRLADEDRKQ